MPSAKVRASHGLQQLLADDPGQMLLYAVEQVQAQAHHRRLGRVLKRTQRRKYQPGWLHVSDAYNPCDLIVAAKLLGFQLPRETITPRLERIFENGTYMHLRWQNTFLSLPSPFQVEIAKILRSWPVIGEADVTVYHPELGKLIVELKSMNTEQFKMLRAPKPEHFRQANTYTGLAGYDAMLVWYENKNDQDVKIFALEFDSKPYNEMLVRVRKIATDLIISPVMPKCCGACGMYEYIGALTDIENRIALLREEEERASA